MSAPMEAARVRIIGAERRTCPFALTIFLAIYAGALFLVISPPEPSSTDGAPVPQEIVSR